MPRPLRTEQRPQSPGTGRPWGGAADRPASARQDRNGPASPAGLAPGDKVLHAKFGEGVVLGVEPGGVVRVFFSGLGEQKRLLLEYAPLRRL